MVATSISERISQHLNEIYTKSDCITLDVIAAHTRLSKETVRRAKDQVGTLREKTAHRLADFIESETDGRVPAGSILATPKNYREQNLKGFKFIDQDLSGAVFTDADLEGAVFESCDLDGAKFDVVNFREAKIVGCSGRNVKMRGCNFRRTQFIDLRMASWDLSGAWTYDESVWRNVWMGAYMHGADLSNVAEFTNVHWRAGGGRARGLVLPKGLDLNEISRGCDVHPIVAQVALDTFPGDKEMRAFAEFTTSRLFFACWESGVKRIKEMWPHRMDDFKTAFGRFPKMDMLDRFEWGQKMEACQSLSDYESLLKDPLYTKFSPVLDERIRS